MGRRNKRMHLKGASPKWHGKTLADITLADGSREPVKYEPIVGIVKKPKQHRRAFKPIP